MQLNVFLKRGKQELWKNLSNFFTYAAYLSSTLLLEQRWSRGHKTRGQGQGQLYRGQALLRPRIALPRTDPLGAKDRNALSQDQRHRRKCYPPKIRSSKFFFRRSSKDENQKGLCKFSARFLAFFNKILPIQKIVLSSSRGQGNFRGLEASRLRT